MATERELFDALVRHNPKHAIMRQATIDDVEYARRQAAYYKSQWPEYYARNPNNIISRIDTTGIDPESYDPSAPAYRRIDALMFGSLTKHGDYQRTAVEIKVSRSDFKRETEEKRAPWLRVVHRFVYLVPEGLIRAEEVPEGLGLWEWTGRSIRSIKRCTINHHPDQLPESFTRSLVFRLMKSESPSASIGSDGEA